MTLGINDLSNIRDYIAEINVDAAHVVTERVLRSVGRLEAFPQSGRPGRARGTREVVVPGYPYIVVYTHDDAAVDIVAVFHAAQDRG